MCDLARKGKADSIDIKPRKVNIKKDRDFKYISITK